MLLENKCAIVTGGSRGIGAGIAVSLARQGADVVINYWGETDTGYGKDDAARAVVAEIERLGRSAIALEG
ncbi:MAG: SDR family NAD(P)-dependent oxidoreductase, partial [Alphaproteobacteria bacterium]